MRQRTTPDALPVAPQRQVAALADPDRLPDPQPGYLALEPAALGAEHLAAVPAVVLPLVDGEADAAAGAEVRALVLEPVVGGAAGYLADAPGEDAAPRVADVDGPVVSGREKKCVFADEHGIEIIGEMLFMCRKGVAAEFIGTPNSETFRVPFTYFELHFCVNRYFFKWSKLLEFCF